MKRRDKKTIGQITLIIVAVFLLVSLFIQFDYTIKGPGRFVAQAEWTISQMEQDKLLTRLFSNDFTQKTETSLYHVNRPDYISFRVKDGMAVGNQLSAGEIVAQITSIEDQLRLTSSLGQLQQANAQLAAQKTVLKHTLQEEANRTLQLAKAQLAAYEPVLKRQQELYDQNLISSQEFEITRAQHELYQIDVALQDARVQTARTGEKAEALAVIETQIRASADELELLQKKAAAETYRAPIAGILVQPDIALGELLHLCKTDTMVVQMPIKVTDIQYVKPGQKVHAYVFGEGRLPGIVTVIGISQSTRMVNRQPMYIAAAYVENQDQKLLQGMTGTFVIMTGRASLMEMMRRSWKNFRFNK